MTATAGSQRSVAVAGGNTGVSGQLIGDTTVGHVMIGGILSMTTTVWLQVAEFPQSSVAVQVLVVLYVFGQGPATVTSANVRATIGSQRSDTIGSGNTGVAGQLIGDVAGGQTILGGVTSCTTIVRLHVAVLPQSSVAVHVLVTL